MLVSVLNSKDKDINRTPSFQGTHGWVKDTEIKTDNCNAVDNDMIEV